MYKQGLFVGVLSVGACTGAIGQTAILIDIDDPTLAPGESTVVTLSVAFPASDGALASVATDFETTVGSTGWSDWQLVEPLTDAGATPGEATARGFEGIIAGQLAFPPGGMYPDPSNPIRFWQATYTAPADVSVPFDVQLSTITRDVFVYLDPLGGPTESRGAGLVEGAGTISVIPAPASLALLGLGGLAACRRRR